MNIRSVLDTILDVPRENDGLTETRNGLPQVGSRHVRIGHLGTSTAFLN